MTTSQANQPTEKFRGLLAPGFISKVTSLFKMQLKLRLREA